MMLDSVRSAGCPATVRSLNDPCLYSARVRKSKTATIIESPFSAMIWQPVCCESLKLTGPPNVFSAASWSSALQTSFVPPSDGDALDDPDGDWLGDSDEELVAVGLAGWAESSARVPRPEIVFEHPTATAAASRTATAARARRATMGGSSSVTAAVRTGAPHPSLGGCRPGPGDSPGSLCGMWTTQPTVCVRHERGASGNPRVRSVMGGLVPR